MDPLEKDKMSNAEFAMLYAGRKFDDFDMWIMKHKYLLLVNFLSVMFSLVVGKSLLVAALTPLV